MTEQEGFWLEQAGGECILHQKYNGIYSRLIEINDELVYEFNMNRIVLKKNNFDILDFEIKDNNTIEINVEKAVDMYWIMRGARSLIGPE